MRIGTRARRQALVLYVQDLLSGTVVELDPSGTGAPPDPEGDEAVRRLVLERGATSYARHDGAPSGEAGQVDVVLAPSATAATLEAIVVEARRLLKPSGVLVLACPSSDRVGKGERVEGGASYYDLLDRLDGRFGGVTMVGQAPFVGAAFVEYGTKDPAPIVDGTLLGKGERVEWYVAIASDRRLSVGGYALVQVPAREAVAPAAVEKIVEKVVERPVETIVERVVEKVVERPGPPADAELVERLRQRERALVELQEAMALHAREMEAAQAAIRDRDAYIRELERDGREAQALRVDARRAEARAQAAAERERQARLALAEAEGRFLRARLQAKAEAEAAAQAAASPAGIAAASAAVAAEVAAQLEGLGREELVARYAALEAECARLRRKEEEARAESWKHLKARGDAEAQLRALKDETVNKLRDARKLANHELTRAMEEATRKAVTLRDELTRSERERKELAGEVARLREELERLRDGAGAEPPLAQGGQATSPVEVEAEGAHERVRELAAVVAQLEEELQKARAAAQATQATQATTATMQTAAQAALEAAEAERARHARLVAEAEAEAKRCAEAAVRARVTAREREREIELLREALRERDARLNALEAAEAARASEAQSPTATSALLATAHEEEVAQLQARIGELVRELERRDLSVERAIAAAAHERARAERLVAEERRALVERNDARARLAELEARVATLRSEAERLAREREAEADRAQRAEREAEAQRERGQRLADAASGRADHVRQRLSGLTSVVESELRRLASLEAKLDADR
jgi:hypothetical protein